MTIEPSLVNKARKLILDDVGIVITTLIVIILNSLFVLACFYATPSADDYCYAELLKNKGFIYSQTYWYNNWSGRYIANILLSLTPVDHSSILIYRLLLTVVNLALFATLFYLLKEVVLACCASNSPRPNNLHDIPLVGLAGLVGLTSYLSYTEPAENIYWAAGVLTYQLSLSCLFLASAGLIRIMRVPQTKIFSGNAVFAAVCIFVAFGLNETTSLISLGVNAFTAVYLLLLAKRASPVLYLSLLFSLICFLIVYLAPGNSLRANVMGASDSHSIFDALAFSSKESVKFVLLRFSKAESIILCIATYVVAKRYFVASGTFGTSIRLLVPLGAVISVFLGFFASAYVNVRLPPPRAIGAISFIFNTLIAISIILCAVTEPARADSRNVWANNIKLIIITFIICCSFLYSKNSKTLLLNFYTNSLIEYTEKHQIRGKEIAKCLENQDQECVLTRLADVKNTVIVHFSDISTDRNAWANQCFARFYNIEVLIVR